MADKETRQVKKSNLLPRLLALVVTAALVLGALALVVYRDRLNVDALRRWLSYRSLETSDTGQAAPFTHAGGDRMSLAYLDGRVLTASAAGAHYYALSGELIAEEVAPLDNPVLSVSRTAGAVYDAGGQSLFLFRNGEERPAPALEEGADLLSVRPNDSGWMAVTAQHSGYKGAVTVYDAQQEPVIQISLSSTFAVDAALSPDNRTVAVVTMDQTGGQFASTLLFYPVDQSEPSAQVDLGNLVVLDLEYESGQLWVLGEDQLAVVSADGGQVARYDLGRSYLKDCDLGGDGFALLLTGPYREGSADRAVVVGPDGLAVQTLELTRPVLDLSAAGSYCALLTGSDLTIYTRDLTLYAALDDPQGARLVDLAADGSALLADSQRAWLFLPG